MIACFPTYARQLPNTDLWKVKVAGMLAVPLPESSRWRSPALAMLRRALEVGPEYDADPIFQARVAAFLFQRVVGCRLRLQVGGHELEGGPTDRLGHFEQSVDVDPSRLSSPSDSTTHWITYQAQLDTSDQQVRRLHSMLRETAGREIPEHLDLPAGGGRVECIPHAGLSVISDIDDTVKLTNVADRRELLANTFLRPFQAVQGMAELYHQWQAAGTAFHYVSSSPWQLAGCLGDFFQDAGLPPGSMHLSHFRFKDMTPLGRLTSKKRSKRRAIEKILADFPGRRFVLVGDSGEKDPEIYATVARRFPQQVVAIAIREVASKPRAKSLTDRIEHLRNRLPAGLLTTFREASELAERVASVAE